MSDSQKPAGREVRLAALTLPEVKRYAEKESTVLIPVGAIEQHGEHLPLWTDTLIVESLLLDCAKEFENVLVAPPIPWGLSQAHSSFGLAFSLEPSTFLALLLQIGESLLNGGFSRQVWVNGHNGNKGVLATLVYESQRIHGLSIATLTYYDLVGETFAELRRSPLGGAGHACEFETSLMEHLSTDPLAAAAPGTGSARADPPLDAGFRDMFHPGTVLMGSRFASQHPDGVAGSPDLASANLGKTMYEACLASLVVVVRQFGEIPPEDIWEPLRPHRTS